MEQEVVEIGNILEEIEEWEAVLLEEKMAIRDSCLMYGDERELSLLKNI